MRYWQGEFITKLKENQIFTFGSNPQARHFAGAAKVALKFGAKPIKRNSDGSVKEKGIGRGLSKQTYALVTKNLEAGYYEEETGITYESDSFRSVSPDMLIENIKELYECAKKNQNLDFLIVYKYEKWPNGSPKKSLNGYDAEDMISFFTKAGQIPKNIVFHESYEKRLEETLRVQEFKNQEQKKEKFDYLDDYNKKGFAFFWHSPSPFSQWHPAVFKVNNSNKDPVYFTSAEQFMMYCKAKLFKDDVIAEQITSYNYLDGGVLNEFLNGKISREEILSNPSKKTEWDQYQKSIKALGRKVSGYNEEIWVKNRVKFVSRGNLEKFDQNADLKDHLLKLGDKILAEANPFDKIWAIGLKENDPKSNKPDQWQGKNLLGKILTHLKRKYQLELSVSDENTPKKQENISNKFKP